jgi:hypothetical protein
VSLVVSYDIAYDDGKLESQVLAENVRKLGTRRAKLVSMATDKSWSVVFDGFAKVLL